MYNGNPSKINFTWYLPNGNIYLGYYLNTTSSYITVIPDSTTDFGQATCRAQNEVGLFGECHVNMILGGESSLFLRVYILRLNSIYTCAFLF
jgi:hypothetical protein